MESEQPRRVTVFTAEVNPAVPTSFVHPIRLPFPPFTTGSWSITYAPPPSKPGRYEPAAVKLRWSYCEERQERNARLAVEADGEVHSLDMALGTKPSCEWIVLVGRPSKTLRVVLELDEPQEQPTAVDRCMALIDQHQLVDICLTFPGDRRTLYASSAVLAAASPWWDSYLSTSGFFEDSMSIAHTPAEPGWPDSDCSDDDEDGVAGPSRGRRTPLKKAADLADAIPASPPPSPPTRTRPLIPSHMRIVPITGTSYRTYRAFLAWLLTGTVSFAPLTSTFLYPSSTSPSLAVPADVATAQRRASLAPLRSLHPSRPAPVSPKSLYRLSHFLDIPSLSSQCLAALTDALTPKCVAHELFAPPAMGEVYDEVWEREVAFAEEQWEDVRESQAMRDAAERMKSDGGAGAHELATLLRLSGVGP
ncbi:hypothetical protein JCM10450v2_003749 [Rhodotorula kratochvilovae]